MRSLAPENLEKLFLFEVYVESLRIDYPKLCFTQNCLNSLKETIIQFQFLGFQPVEIKEEEFIGEENNCGNRKVNAGKSCLFSLRDMPREVRCIEVDVKVMRNTVQDSYILLAVTSVKLGEQFAEILRSPRIKKKSTSLKKPFTLYDKKCSEVGKITVNFNLSCFGKIITTSFQMDGEDSKAYVVQPGGEVPIADFLKSESSLDKGVCPGSYRSGSYQPGSYQSGSYQPGSYHPGSYHPGMTRPSAYPVMMPAGGLMEGLGTLPPMPPLHTFPGRYPTQWIPPGGLLGGAQPRLSSTAPHSKALNSVSSSSSSDESTNPAPPPFQVCSCDYSLPPGFLAPGPIKKKKKKKKKKECPMSMNRDFCMHPNCPKGYPQLPTVEEIRQVCQAMEVPAGVIGMKGEQMVFQMPQDNQPIPGNRKARFSLGDGHNGNFKDVRIMTDGETKKFTVPNKANDIYVIKVGKTNQETDQRQKMVLEVKQPRPPTDDRTFYDIRTQYAEGDFMSEPPKKEKPKKKGKGKGKKGKKGKGKGKKGKKK